MAGYTWYSGTLTDGLITTSWDVSNQSWTDVMDDAGPLSITLPLGDDRVARLNPYATAEPCRCFLACSYFDTAGAETFLAGGPIWTHVYDDDKSQLTVGASGLWSLWDHRKVIPVLVAGQSAASVTTAYTDLSLGTMAKRLVQQAQTHTGGAVPVVFPDDEVGTNNKNYPGSDLSFVGQMLRNLTGEIGGPEIAFTPRKSADGAHIEWAMEIGTTEQPFLVQAGADHSWDKSVPKSSVSSLSVNRDGTSTASRGWTKGSGSDTDTVIGMFEDDTLVDSGFPLLEGEDDHLDVTIQATADSWAQAVVVKSQRTVDTWTMKVRRDEPPVVGTYRRGHWTSVLVANHRYLPAGKYRARILQISGDNTDDVTLQLAPNGGPE